MVLIYREIDPDLFEDMEIAAIIRERIAAGEPTSMDDLLREYGIIDLSNSAGELDPFKLGKNS